MALGNINLTPQFVQAVRDAVDIVDLTSEHTRLTKAGKRYKGLCPLHKEKSPSFSVEPMQGLYYCFGCGEGGDGIDLHMKLSGDDFPAAIESLAQRYGVPIPAQAARRSGPAGPDTDGALAAAQDYFTAALAKADGPRQYLAERQISSELIEKFGLGYAPPGWQNMLDTLGGKVPLKDLEAAGLIARSPKSGKHYDRFRERLMFPVRGISGRLVGFGGRALDDDKAKYVNTAETERFHKGYLLYGMDLAKRQMRDGGKVLLVEGYFDLIGAVAAGIDWVVASMGTALTESQAKLMARYCDEVIVGYDGDEAGERAARKAIPILLSQNLGVRRAQLGSGHDPDSLRVELGVEALRTVVDEAPDSVAMEFERLAPPGVAQEPRRQATAAKEIAELLAPIGDGVLRYGYARQAADRLGIPVDLLWRRLGGRGDQAQDESIETKVVRNTLVQSEEDKVLQLLIGGVEVGDRSELPPGSAFFDEEYRQIYESWVDLSKDGAKPTSQDLLEALGGKSLTIARLAQSELELPAAQGSDELVAALSKLRRRWQRQRARELTADIAEAERQGDIKKMQTLLQEKATLSRALHPRH